MSMLFQLGSEDWVPLFFLKLASPVSTAPAAGR